MPDFYQKGEYDLGGFAVGFLPPSRALPLKSVKAGDALIGIASSGVHSNGFSLLRKLLPSGKSGDARARELLTPTRIYAKALAPLIEARSFKGLAHITGSGFLNVPRISEKVSYEIELPGPGKRPPIYEWITDSSRLSLTELAQTFNMGIGMVGVVPAGQAASVLKKLKRSGESAWQIGEVVKKGSKSSSQVHLSLLGERVSLQY